MTDRSEYDIYKNISDMNQVDQDLIERAERAMASSHSPYSGFRVGCTVLLENGEYVNGSNQENASYPAGSCAENITLNTCSTLHPKVKIKNIAVVAQKHDEDNYTSVTPCGICRQVLLEFETKQQSPISIIMKIDSGDWIKTHNSAMLLPFSFTKDNLCDWKQEK